MTYALNTNPYVLPFQTDDLPNARTLVGINGIQLLDSGAGQNLTIAPYGNLLSLDNLNTTGFVYSTAGALTTKTFGSSSTTTVSESGGVLNVNVTPQTSIQLLNFYTQGSLNGNGSGLDIVSFGNITVDSFLQGPKMIYSLGVENVASNSEGFILNESSSSLPNAQSLGDLTTGLLKNTVSSSVGTLSIATPSVDYVVPNQNLTDISAISPVLGRLITGSGTNWVNLDIGADGTFLQSNGTASFWGTLSSSVAPSTAPYVTFTANGTLTNTQNIGLLTSGLLKNTVTSSSGALTAAVNGTDYYGPGFAVAIADGGTGQTTANAAFNALSPMAHNGDLITRTSNIASALQIGTNGQVLTVASSLPVWATPTVYAPTTATYVTLQSESALSAAFSLGSLTTGLLLNTVSGGVATITQAVNGTNYYGPGFAVAIADGGTGQTTKTNAFNALSPMTTAADIIVGGSSGSGTRLAKGTANQVLAMSSDASTIQWTTNSSDASAWSTFPALQNVAMATYRITGLGDPTGAQDAVTKNYLTANYNTTAYVADIAHGGTGQTTANAAFNALSPMTTPGDVMYRNNGNVATNLAIGTGGQILTVYGGLPVWANPAIEAPVNGPYLTFTNNGTLTNSQNLGALTTGLLLNTVSAGSATLTKATNGTDYYGPGFAVRIADGGTGTTTKAAGFDALSPMTTSGDVIYGGASGTGTRLAAGSNGQVLTLAGGVPSWAIPSGVVPWSVLGSGVAAVTIAAQQGYVPTNTGSVVVFTLPTTMAVGAVFRIGGFGAAGWQLAQTSGQSIYFGNQNTTVGTGSLASTNAQDCVEIVCVVANTTFLVVSSVGNITIL